MATTVARRKRKAAQALRRPRQAAPRAGWQPGPAALWSIGAAAVAAGAALTGYLARRQIAAWAAAPAQGHDAPDLQAAVHPGAQARAPEHFRPDPTAPVAPEDREALRPATGPAPSLVAERGTMNAQTAPSN